MKVSSGEQVLAQARMLAARVEALEKQANSLPSVKTPSAAEPTTGFGDLMKQPIASVNQSVQSAEMQAGAFLRQEPGADLAETMVAVNKAQVSFRMMVEVRNRLIQAYQDVANMPI